MAEIGATLREARMRARIDVSEIEAQTKIRAKYLRALENEEWDLLPGPTFVRSFLRTYAQALGLDAKALVDEYRTNYEQPSELDHQPAMSPPRRVPARASPARPGGPSRTYTIAVGGFGLLIVVLIVALIAGQKKGAESPPQPANSPNGRTSRGTARSHRGAKPSTSATAGNNGTRVTLSLHPTAPVYVCLIDAVGAKRIPGLTIEPGSYTPRDYHSTRFELLLGNNAVTLYVDGKALTVPPSSKPIGYSITNSGRRVLSAAQQPTCG
jgi:cytoskeleton protein RodZ